MEKLNNVELWPSFGGQCVRAKLSKKYARTKIEFVFELIIATTTGAVAI